MRFAFHAMVAVGAFALPAVALDTVYSQPQGSGLAAGISRTAPGGFAFTNRRLADNFAVGLDSTIERVTWWGGTESDFFGPTNLSNISGFNITIYTDAGGNVGTEIYSENVSFASTNATQVPGQFAGILNAAMFEFSVDLSSAVSIDGGSQYWISIAASLFNNPGLNFEAWQWARSDVGDDLIAQDRFDGMGFLPRTLANRNAAFVLEGTVIPAPAGLVPLGVGLFLARRRRG